MAEKFQYYAIHTNTGWTVLKAWEGCNVGDGQVLEENLSHRSMVVLLRKLYEEDNDKNDDAIKYDLCKYLARFNGITDYDKLPDYRKDTYKSMVNEIIGMIRPIFIPVK